MSESASHGLEAGKWAGIDEDSREVEGTRWRPQRQLNGGRDGGEREDAVCSGKEMGVAGEVDVVQTPEGVIA